MLTEFLIANATTIVTIVVILVGMVGLLLSKKWNELRGEAYKLILQMETLGNTVEGKEKFDKALNTLYGLVPVTFKPFLTKDLIAGLLQKCYDEIKDYLDDGVLNGSTKDAE